MKFLNLSVEEDIASERPIRLDLGSGGKQRTGFYSVDHLALLGVDIVADLNEPFDRLPDNCVAEIRSRHTLEHVHELLPLMREIHRICRDDARIEIIVPHFSNVYGYSDPTHVRFFGLYTMYYFVGPDGQPPTRSVPSFYTDVRFKIDSIRIEFYRQGRLDRLLARQFERIFNRDIRWQDFYERRFSRLFHAWQIRYVMHPDKSAAE